MLFLDRTQAGRVLASALAKYAGRHDVIVLALPRGGVPVAYEVACALDAPLDIFLVRKLGVPGHEELALGAIASGGICVLNEDVVHGLGLSNEVIQGVIEKERGELQRREQAFRGNRPPPLVSGQIVILIDDGLATGSTMRAALAALQGRRPAKIIVAVPVGAPETCTAFQQEADEVICARTPEPLWSVGSWYDDFTQTTDEEVCRLLEKAARRKRTKLAIQNTHS